MLLGSLLLLIAAIGILRLPDVYLRMSAVSKAATLGVVLTLAGAAWHFGSLTVATKLTVTVFFLYLTAPVAAHRIGRSAYRRGEPLSTGTRDQLADDRRAGRQSDP
jgi:multicomponent Na+:H+ antiporter subunit G